MGIYGLIQGLHRLTKSGTAIPIPNFIYQSSPSIFLILRGFRNYTEIRIFHISKRTVPFDNNDTDASGYNCRRAK